MMSDDYGAGILMTRAGFGAARIAEHPEMSTVYFLRLDKTAATEVAGVLRFMFTQTSCEFPFARQQGPRQGLS